MFYLVKSDPSHKLYVVKKKFLRFAEEKQLKVGKSVRFCIKKEDNLEENQLSGVILSVKGMIFHGLLILKN